MKCPTFKQQSGCLELNPTYLVGNPGKLSLLGIPPCLPSARVILWATPKCPVVICLQWSLKGWLLAQGWPCLPRLEPSHSKPLTSCGPDPQPIDSRLVNKLVHFPQTPVSFLQAAGPLISQKTILHQPHFSLPKLIHTPRNRIRLITASVTSNSHAATHRWLQKACWMQTLPLAPQAQLLVGLLSCYNWEDSDPPPPPQHNWPSPMATNRTWHTR